MDGQSRRAHERFKDDRRVCRARLEDESGGSLELSVIDMSAGGAALCGVQDTSTIPRASGRSLTRGRAKFKVPSPSKRKASKTVDVGSYKVLRRWSRGLGNDAGIAIKFTKPRGDWLKLLDDQRFQTSLRGTEDR